MTVRELNANERAARTAKAAYLAIAIERALPTLHQENERVITATLESGLVREHALTIAGFGHASEKTWDLVAQLLVPRRRVKE